MENKGLKLGLLAVKLIIIVIGIVFFVKTILANSNDELIDFNSEAANGVIAPSIMYTLYVIIAAAILAVIFALVNTLANLKAALSTIAGIIALAAIFMISKAMTSGEPVSGSVAGLHDQSTIDLVGAGLQSFYIVAIVAIAVTVLGELRNIFK